MSVIGNGSNDFAVVTWDFEPRLMSSVTIQGTVYSASGNTGSKSKQIGWSTTCSWSAVDTSGTNYSGSITTAPAPAPPSPPNPATDASVTGGTGSGPVVQWTASSGGATGYEIRRGGVSVGSIGSSPYTDTSNPTTRPLTYQVFAYNQNVSGTAYATGSNIVTLGGDSVGILTT